MSVMFSNFEAERKTKRAAAAKGACRRRRLRTFRTNCTKTGFLITTAASGSFADELYQESMTQANRYHLSVTTSPPPPSQPMNTRLTVADRRGRWGCVLASW